MLEQSQPMALVEAPDNVSADEPLDIRAILASCKILPAVVAKATFTSVIERVVDQEVLDRLTSEAARSSNSGDWLDRRKRREAALSQYLGHILVCVFIRLPGIHYTIEIDPQNERVIHCEWQKC